MTRYAADTSVPADRSKAEIERHLTRFGATRFAYGWAGEQATVGFTLNDHTVRMALPLPDRHDTTFTVTPSGRWARTEKQAQEAYEQEIRRRWRALAAVIKAKLIAIEEGISTVEREFLADLVLPTGDTVGEWTIPQLKTFEAGDLLALPSAG